MTASPRKSPVTMFADQRTVVTVTGSLDATTAPDLECLVADNRAPNQVVVLELSGIEQLTADGVAALVRIRERLEAPLDEPRLVLNEIGTAALAEAGEADRFTHVQHT